LRRTTLPERIGAGEPVPTVAAQPRQLSLETPLGPGALTLVGLSGREAISELFAFELDLVAASGTSLRFDSVLGRPITVGLGGGRFVSGIVSRFSAGPDQRQTSFRAELVPSLWLLTRSTDSRIFQHESVPEIARTVLADHGQSATFTLERSYEPRNYCVQYRESAFDFLRRILAEEGLWFTFHHEAGAHELVVGDSAPPGPDVGTFPFEERGPERAGSPRVLEWEKAQELTSVRVALRDHHFQQPSNDLEGIARIPASVQAGQVTHSLALGANAGLELYDYPGGYAARFDGDDLQQLVQSASQAAALRMDEEAAGSLVVTGRSTCSAFTGGATFTLAAHGDADGGYVLTRVEHWATQPAGASGAVGFQYANAFTCIPTALPYRPPGATRAPVVAGPQTAVVTGPAGARTYVDELGRVKVKFFWDRRGTADENSSCWIRVAQPVGGTGGGFFWVPEVGDEVLVGFEHGDVNRPVVIGRLYNAADKPPPDDDDR
jgi:type VI secretion system secreted protein VgrG